MHIVNLTNQDYWFGPLHLPAAGAIDVDDTSATSLYLTDDSVADAINTLYAATPAKITVSGQAAPFPRATGKPEVLHGDGSPEGIVYAGQGSIYLRRDNSGGTQLYQKSTGIHLNTGWIGISGSIINPSGTIQMWGGATAPTGYLLCDGSAVSRSTYADLFAAIGTSYGAGDGSTTFNVPDLRGRVGVGYATSGGHTDVSTLGLNDGLVLANRRPKHRHTLIYGGGSGGTTGLQTGVTDSANNTYTNKVGDPAGVATDNLDAPPYVVVNYIIKT